MNFRRLYRRKNSVYGETREIGSNLCSKSLKKSSRGRLSKRSGSFVPSATCGAISYDWSKVQRGLPRASIREFSNASLHIAQKLVLGGVHVAGCCFISVISETIHHPAGPTIPLAIFFALPSLRLFAPPRPRPCSFFLRAARVRASLAGPDLLPPRPRSQFRAPRI